MITRDWLSGPRVLPGALLVLAWLAPEPAHAQIYQVQRGESRNAIGFNLGYFQLRGEDSRPDDEVLRVNVFNQLFDLEEEREPLGIEHFNSAAVGGEWLYGLTDHLETSLGVGFYRKTVPTIYRDFVDTDGSDIRQEFRFRVVPIAATIRFLPIGRGAAVEPYVGAGLGVFLWRYTETGEFIDFFDNTIFSESYRADGTAFGPVILGGLRFPVGDVWSIGGELRWQRAETDTDAAQTGLLGETIDLGGVTYSFTMHVRF